MWIFAFKVGSFHNDSSDAQELKEGWAQESSGTSLSRNGSLWFHSVSKVIHLLTNGLGWTKGFVKPSRDTHGVTSLVWTPLTFAFLVFTAQIHGRVKFYFPALSVYFPATYKSNWAYFLENLFVPKVSRD